MKKMKRHLNTSPSIYCVRHLLILDMICTSLLSKRMVFSYFKANLFIMNVKLHLPRTNPANESAYRQ